jgi:TatD DNase family protein
MIAYNIRNALYLNITNKCTSACVFCVIKITDYVKGHNLRLEKDPSVAEIIKAIDASPKYNEVVFCGYGEPTLRLDVLKEVASYVKAKNIPTRLNTNGHGDLIHNRHILPELKGLIDNISISLNGVDAEEYFKVSRPKFGKDTFDKVLEFITLAKQYIPHVEVTTVTYPGIDISKCRKIAEKLGVDFRVRIYNEVG